MTDHSPDHAERAAQQMLADRGRFPSGGDVPFDVTLSLVAAALRGREAGVEAAWRVGFDSARQCLSEDEAFTLTEDVEQDAWLDSAVRASLHDTVRGEGENG